MGVCKFYINGYCKFGERCHFEHIKPQHQLNNTSFSSNFSFTKTLENINRQQFDNNQKSFSQYNNVNYDGSFFGRQVPNNVGSAKTFSFNQALQRIDNYSKTNIQNVPSKPNLFAIQEDQMESDVDFSTSTSFKPQNNFLFGGNASNIFHSFPFNNSTQSMNQNQVANVPPRSSKSFFNTNNQQHTQQHAQQQGQKPIKEEQKLNSEIYSQLKQLSKLDLTNFQADKFNSPIPLIPPPYELCF